MHRRTFLKLSAAAAATTVAAPAIAQSAGRPLTLIPDSDLSLLDPISTTAKSTNAHGYAVFDTLFGLDSSLQAQPQMVGEIETSEDGLTTTLRLREGLRFHDGEPVLARDCVASVQRWGKVDQWGQSMMVNTNEIEAVSDTDLRFHFKQRFPHVPTALAQFNAYACFIMPERLASAEPTEPNTEMVGSGPFRYVAEEREVGNQVVYEKNHDYIPRDEEASGTAGGKRVYIDRAIWRVISDQATAATALQSGEVDWWVFPQADLLAIFEGNPDVTVETLDPLGEISLIRLNSLQPPFNNPEIRRIVASAIDQAEFMQVQYGASGWQTCYALYPCGLPGVEEVAATLMGEPKDYAKLTADLVAAGYMGERVVIMQPVNRPYYSATAEVAAATLRRIGMNVDLQPMDYATLLQRRTLKSSVDEGGWSIFPSGANSTLIKDPVGSYIGRGLGESGWPGWHDDADVEGAVREWLSARSPQEQAQALTMVQEAYFESPGSIPVGMGFPKTAYRSDISGVIPAMNTLMWNIRRD